MSESALIRYLIYSGFNKLLCSHPCLQYFEIFLQGKGWLLLFMICSQLHLRNGCLLETSLTPWVEFNITAAPENLDFCSSPFYLVSSLTAELSAERTGPGLLLHTIICCVQNPDITGHWGTSRGLFLRAIRLPKQLSSSVTHQPNPYWYN